jgi:hypothetical protein
LLSRESTTLSFSKPQNGHFMDEGKSGRNSPGTSIVTGKKTSLYAG